MKSLDRTAQSIDALIQANARDAASDLVRTSIAPLVTHVGLERVTQWCAQLGLDELLDLPRALAAAHVVREQKGAIAVREYFAVAQLAHARGDAISEFHALSAMYSTGFMQWTGFAEMQREYARINALFDAQGATLSTHDAVACLPGLLAARMLFATSAAEAAIVGERVVALAHDASLPDALRLTAATHLMPWFVHATTPDRLIQTHRVFTPLADDPRIDAVTRLTYRSTHALATAFLYAADPSQSAYAVDTTDLVNAAEQTGLQWLRFWAKRAVFERAIRSRKNESAAALLDELEAMLDPANSSQVLSVRFRRASLALRHHRYAESLASATVCVNLAHALEIPNAFVLMYNDSVASALLGLNRFDEAIAMYDRILSFDAPPGHRMHYSHQRALARALLSLERYQKGKAQPDIAENDASVATLRTHLATLSELCAGSLSAQLLNVFPTHCSRITAAMFELGMGTDSLARDVLERSVSPPETRPAAWPWHLRIRLFDGFECEGIANNTQEGSKKGESKSAQLLQYLAAHSPGSVSAQRLADALWPEAEGDKAMRSLDVALTRLRPTLPDPTLVIRQEGKVGFDRRRVWCDTDAALLVVDEIRARSQRGGAAHADTGPADTAHGAALARSALDLLEIYRGPLLPDSREAFARDRSDYFRSQVAGAVQIGLRAAVRLPEPTTAEEIIRLSVGRGLPATLVRSVIADLASMGDNTSRRASELNDVFVLARG